MNLENHKSFLGLWRNSSEKQKIQFLNVSSNQLNKSEDTTLTGVPYKYHFSAYFKPFGKIKVDLTFKWNLSSEPDNNSYWIALYETSETNNKQYISGSDKYIKKNTSGSWNFGELEVEKEYGYSYPVSLKKSYELRIFNSSGYTLAPKQSTNNLLISIDQSEITTPELGNSDSNIEIYNELNSILQEEEKGSDVNFETLLNNWNKIEDNEAKKILKALLINDFNKLNNVSHSVSNKEICSASAEIGQLTVFC